MASGQITLDINLLQSCSYSQFLKHIAVWVEICNKLLNHDCDSYRRFELKSLPADEGSTVAEPKLSFLLSMAPTDTRLRFFPSMAPINESDNLITHTFKQIL